MAKDLSDLGPTFPGMKGRDNPNVRSDDPTDLPGYVSAPLKGGYPDPTHAASPSREWSLEDGSGPHYPGEYTNPLEKVAYGGDADSYERMYGLQHSGQGKGYRSEPLYGFEDNLHPPAAAFALQDRNIKKNTPMDFNSIMMRYLQADTGEPVDYDKSASEAYPDGLDGLMQYRNSQIRKKKALKFDASKLKENLRPGPVRRKVRKTRKK
jgi:hypothetical protein